MVLFFRSCRRIPLFGEEFFRKFVIVFSGGIFRSALERSGLMPLLHGRIPSASFMNFSVTSSGTPRESSRMWTARLLRWPLLSTIWLWFASLRRSRTSWNVLASKRSAPEVAPHDGFSGAVVDLLVQNGFRASSSRMSAVACSPQPVQLPFVTTFSGSLTKRRASASIAAVTYSTTFGLR